MKTIQAIFLALFVMVCAAIFAAAQANTPLAFHQLAELTASDGAAQDFLGVSICLMNGNTLVAGAPQSGATGSAGKAYVFVKPASGWANMTQTAELTPSDGVPGMGFGYGVAISGDTIIAGTSNGASVYVFVEPAGGWTDMTETAELKLASGNSLYAVAISGNTIVASAPSETIGSNEYQGAVYIFERPESGWRSGMEPKARLTASDGLAKDFLGFALSSDDNTVVATVVDRAAYVFVKPKGGWVTTTQTAELTGSSGSDAFGYSVAISGGTTVVGAPQAGFGQDYYGAAFVFGNHGGEISASNPAYYNFFGESVAVSGNLIVVGADGVEVGENQYEGAAYVFQDATQIAELTPTPGIEYEEMGWSVAAGGTTAAAGALYATVGSNAEQGEVYVFGP
jgi:hypothetical protein